MVVQDKAVIAAIHILFLLLHVFLPYEGCFVAYWLPKSLANQETIKFGVQLRTSQFLARLHIIDFAYYEPVWRRLVEPFEIDCRITGGFLDSPVPLEFQIDIGFEVWYLHLRSTDGSGVGFGVIGCLRTHLQGICKCSVCLK